MRAAPFALACLVLLAGCSDPAAQDGDDVDFSGLDLETTATTGIIRGVVVDEAIRPIGNATVTLLATPPQEQVTGPTGTFGFDGLEPGTYFLQVERARYLDVQQSVEVVAGVAEPPIAKILLVSDGLPEPYAVAYALEGIVECGTSAVAACGGVHDVIVIACVTTSEPPSPTPVCLPQPTNDAYSAFLQLEPRTPDYIQSEMVWQSTQALSTDMYYALRYADRETYDNGMYEGGITSAEGPSPLFANVTRDDIEEAELGNRTGLVFSIFSGTGTYPVGVTVSQRYTFFVHVFYGYTPPEGWRFSETGEVPRPPA